MEDDAIVATKQLKDCYRKKKEALEKKQALEKKKALEKETSGDANLATGPSSQERANPINS